MTPQDPLKSPLHRLQAAAGAAFTETGGWSVADHYGNPREEHLAVRKNAGLIDLSHRGKIRVEGKDRAAFLHGMLTQDVKGLKANQGAYTCVLNAQGRVLADLYLYALEDSFLIDCAAGLTAKIIETLGKYIIIEDVTLKSLTGEYAFLAIEGPQSAGLIKKLTAATPPSPAPNAHWETDIKGVAARIFNSSLSGERGFAVLVPVSDAEKIWGLILEEGPALFGRNAADTLRLEAGIPWYGVDMDERNLFPETGLPHALSESKGCYIGQEVVARLMSYAQVNKKRMGLEISGDEVPAPGSLLFRDGREAGYLTSACRSPSLDKIIGMGYFHRSFAETGRKFEIRTGPDRAGVQAMSAAIPFISLRRA
jgi:glycine cleavage system T protein